MTNDLRDALSRLAEGLREIKGHREFTKPTSAESVVIARCEVPRVGCVVPRVGFTVVKK
jgi:hypothetical protein